MATSAMNRFARRGTLAILLVAPVALAQEAPGPQVETQVVGPAKAGNVYLVSPRGAHLATVTQKGSRFVVLVDGVEGPKFDQILPIESGAQGLFSPDGTRHAYLARSGQDFVVMLDGKELMRPGTTADSFGTPPVSQLAFTSNGKHLWFLQHVHKSNETGDDYSCIVFDGVPEIPGGSNPVFSPDGGHYAYVALNPRDPTQQTVIQDGKPAGYAGTDPQFTGDGLHLIVKTLVPLGPGRGQATQVLLDGKPWIKAESAVLFPAPVGDLVAAVIGRSAPNGNRTSFLVVAGKKIDATESVNISRVTFSPDGKRWAAECETAANTRFLVVDGKKGQEYPMIQNLAFSPDSSRYAYVAMMGGKSFVVVDDEESDGYVSVQEFCFGGGKRTAYIAQSDFTERTVVVDGVALPGKPRDVSDIGFSADGTRCAFIVRDGNYQHLGQDGALDPSLNAMPSRSTIDFKPVPYRLSFDGKHVALLAAPAGSADYTMQGLFLDGKRVQAGQVFFNVTFSPDGRHISWMSPSEKPNRMAVSMDGRRCLEIDDRGPLAMYSRTWEMGADGVLTVLGQDGDVMKRFRVTPSAESSVEILLASASSAAAGPAAK